MPRTSSKRIVFLPLLGVLLGLGCSSTPGEEEAPPQEQDPVSEERADPGSFPDVVARVNEAEITKAQLLERVESIATQARGAMNTSTLSFYREVLDELVGNELLYQSSHERKLAVSADEVDRQLDRIRSQFPDPAALEQALQSDGLTLVDVRTRVERDMSIQKVVESYATGIEVTEDAKRRFYDENPEEMRQPDRLRLSHILKRVSPDATGESREATRVAMAKLLDEARGGADFAALARQHSEDPGSAANGGELVVTRGETVPPFEQAAFALEPGGLSPVVETQFGYHIIKLSERIPGQLVPFDQVQERIGDFLRQRSLQEQIESAVQKLREGARVELFIG